MININLLPDSVRKKESMPLPRLLAVLGVLVAFLLLALVNLHYYLNAIPELENRKRSLQSTRQRLQTEADELKRINAEIAKLAGHVEAVKTLYRQRIVWSKVLSDIKAIVNFDPAMSEYNQDMRYIWLNSITGRDKDLALTGFATTSAGQVAAMRITERLLQGFRSYAPVALPEKDEEEKLQARLREVQTADYALRSDNPDRPVQEKEEADLRKRLEEIRGVKSGGIALKPFSDLFVPPSLRLVNTTWTNAPQASRRAEGSGELFPAQAWSFSINMQLK